MDPNPKQAAATVGRASAGDTPIPEHRLAALKGQGQGGVMGSAPHAKDHDAPVCPGCMKLRDVQPVLPHIPF